MGGEKVQEAVEEKLLNEPILHCDGCQERVRNRDFRTTIPPDRNEAAICEICEEKSKHIRCMSECEQIDYALDGYWECIECREMSFSSESESDEEIAQEL